MTITIDTPIYGYNENSTAVTLPCSVDGRIVGTADDIDSIYSLGYSLDGGPVYGISMLPFPDLNLVLWPEDFPFDPPALNQVHQLTILAYTFVTVTPPPPPPPIMGPPVASPGNQTISASFSFTPTINNDFEIFRRRFRRHAEKKPDPDLAELLGAAVGAERVDRATVAALLTLVSAAKDHERARLRVKLAAAKRPKHEIKVVVADKVIVGQGVQTRFKITATHQDRKSNLAVAVFPPFQHLCHDRRPEPIVHQTNKDLPDHIFKYPPGDTARVILQVLAWDPTAMEPGADVESVVAGLQFVCNNFPQPT